jgi:regulator of CtrA degradation
LLRFFFGALSPFSKVVARGYWTRRQGKSMVLTLERRHMSNRFIKPVSFGERLAASESFSPLFRDGMRLVEDAAAYLDGPGRTESTQLSRAASLTYATESMRLTTGLMQLASWLLIHRAVNEGEISLAQANKKRKHVMLPTADYGEDIPVALPARLRGLIERANALIDRIRRLDATFHAPPTQTDNPFEDQLGMLRAVFERRP